MDRQLKKKRFTLKRIIYATVSAAFFGVVLFYIIWGDKSSKYNVNTDRIQMSEVTRNVKDPPLPKARYCRREDNSGYSMKNYHG